MQRLAAGVLITCLKLHTANYVSRGECGGGVFPDGQHAQVILHPWHQVVDQEGFADRWNHPVNKKTLMLIPTLYIREAGDWSHRYMILKVVIKMHILIAHCFIVDAHDALCIGRKQ